MEVLTGTLARRFGYTTELELALVHEGCERGCIDRLRCIEHLSAV